MNIRPLYDRVLVRRKPELEVSAGGLFIPGNAKGDKSVPVECTVVAVGSGRVLEDGSVRPLVVKAGDRVLVSQWAGSELPDDDGEKNLMVCKEEDLLAVVD